MNNKELQALRLLFFLSAPEAAKLIGNVSERSWRYWETGKYKIPSDVSVRMQELAEKRLNMIEAVDDAIEQQPADEVTIEYYMSFDDYKAAYPDSKPLDWRLSQSVAAFFFAKGIVFLK